ncbi:hypothetical protein BH10CHL1_BH10CHL1_35720 [soil metagenome]
MATVTVLGKFASRNGVIVDANRRQLLAQNRLILTVLKNKGELFCEVYQPAFVHVKQSTRAVLTAYLVKPCNHITGL